ncbi:phage tail tape measure protein, partial [Clostridium butyricum]
ELMGESFKYCASTAGALGYSVQDTAIVLGTMGNEFTKGGAAGNALKNALVNMAKPTDQMKAVMDKYNLSLTNSDGSMKSLADVSKMLRKNMGGLAKDEQAAAAAALFGKEAMAPWLTVINTSEESFNNLSEAIYGADGAAKKMADTKLDTISGQIDILRSGIEGMQIDLGEKLAPYTRKLIEWFINQIPYLTNQVVYFASVITNNMPTIIKLSKTFLAVWLGIKYASAAMKVGNVIGDSIKVGKKAFGVYKNLGGGIKAIGGAFKILSNPVGLVITVIGLLIAGFVLLYQKCEPFRNFINSMIPSLKQFGNFIISSILPVIQQIGGHLAEVFIPIFQRLGDIFTNTILPVLQQFGAFFMENILPLLQQVGEKLGWLFTTILVPLAEFVGVILLASFMGFVDYMANSFITIIDTVGAVIDGLLQIIQGIIDFIVGVFTGNWEQAWNGIVEIFSGIFEGVKGIAKGILNGVIDLINGVISGINSLASIEIGDKKIGIHIPEIPKFANGTQYFKGGLAQINEHGGELVNLPNGSQVIPADKTDKILNNSNGGVQVSVVIQGNVIGNEEYADYVGNHVWNKVKLGLENM